MTSDYSRDLLSGDKPASTMNKCLEAELTVDNGEYYHVVTKKGHKAF